MTARFFIENKIGNGSEVVISDISQIHQISRVFRMKQGDIIELLDNSGFEFKCEIRQLNKKLILLKILEKRKNENEPELKISLFQSIIKKDKMEWVFEKCTEVGVSVFQPIISENSVKLSLREDRAKKILKEATEQSQRAKIPRLSNLVSFKKALELCCEGDVNLIFHEKEEEFSLDFIKSAIKRNSSINIFIGPEGGFSDKEIDMALAKGFKILSLGKRILRAETAAVVSSFLCSAAIE